MIGAMTIKRAFQVRVGDVVGGQMIGETGYYSYVVVAIDPVYENGIVKITLQRQSSYNRFVLRVPSGTMIVCASSEFVLEREVR